MRREGLRRRRGEGQGRGEERREDWEDKKRTEEGRRRRGCKGRGIEEGEEEKGV